MEDYFEKRQHIINEENTAKSMNQIHYNEKLSLRKEKMNKKIKELREDNLNKLINDNKRFKSFINIEKITGFDEIKKNPEAYIKSEYQIKSWFKHIFGNNENNFKMALYLLDLFVSLQVIEIKDVSKRILSRNNTELIAKLISFLNCSDNSIKLTIINIITNLTLFPKSIENVMYSENNLKILMDFFKKTENVDLFDEYIFFLINFTTIDTNRKTFIDNAGLEFLYNYMCQNKTQSGIPNVTSAKHNIYILKNNLLLNCLRILNNEEYKNQYIKCFDNFIPIIKNYINIYCLENPWSIETEYIKFIEVLSLFVIKAQKCYQILQDDFSSKLINLYEKINIKDVKIKLLMLLSDLISESDSCIDMLIHDGILNLLNSEFEKYIYSDYKILFLIIFICSNIASGSQLHIESLYMSGLLNKIILFVNSHLNDYMDKDMKLLIYNSIFTLANASSYGNEKVLFELLNFEDMVILKIIVFGLKNDFDPKQETNFKFVCVDSLEKYLIVAENLSDIDFVNKIKDYYAKIGLEELLNNILSKSNIDENFAYACEKILNSIKTI